MLGTSPGREQLLQTARDLGNLELAPCLDERKEVGDLVITVAERPEELLPPIRGHERSEHLLGDPVVEGPDGVGEKDRSRLLAPTRPGKVEAQLVGT